MFQIYRVDRNKIEVMVEQLGTKRKFWFQENNRQLLFKAEERGTGEDWAEKIACELCSLLGLPHVHYELAEEWEGGKNIYPGVVCETCSPPPASLVLGNQLLGDLDSGYSVHDGQKYKVRKHTVAAVVNVLRKLSIPSEKWISGGIPADITTALDIFVGYVMLDAWIANQDRHHENWGATLEDRLRLAPTFDHGASLARNLSDIERQKRLRTRDGTYTVEYFAQRAQSAFYSTDDSPRPAGTLDAFLAFGKCTPKAASAWLDRLATIEQESLRQILREVPIIRMTEVAKEFTLKLLLENQRRLLKEKSS